MSDTQSTSKQKPLSLLVAFALGVALAAIVFAAWPNANGATQPTNAPAQEQAAAADEHRRLREGISRLPEEQQEALVMTQLEGVSYEIAAKRLGGSEGTVKSRVNRAKAKLKEWLSGSGELSPPGDVQRSKGGGDRP